MAEYIEREAAIDALQNHYEVRNAVQNGIMDECVMLMMRVPAADVTPVRHGRWIVDDISGIVKCSECINDAPLDTTGGGQWYSPFCHSCGAIMDGSEEVR